MDIVERLRKSGNWEWEIENICGEAADEIERLRKELKKIAAVDDEILPTPSTSEEAVLWSTLGACVDLARKALESE